MGTEVCKACSASVDSPVELTVYGLSQSGIKNMRLRAEDAEAAVKHSIPSLSLLLTPLSATQQAYWWGQWHSYSMLLSSPVAGLWTWVIFKAESCTLSIAAWQEEYQTAMMFMETTSISYSISRVERTEEGWEYRLITLFFSKYK